MHRHNKTLGRGTHGSCQGRAEHSHAAGKYEEPVKKYVDGSAHKGGDHHQFWRVVVSQETG